MRAQTVSAVVDTLESRMPSASTPHSHCDAEGRERGRHSARDGEGQEGTGPVLAGTVERRERATRSSSLSTLLHTKEAVPHHPPLSSRGPQRVFSTWTIFPVQAGPVCRVR